MITDSLQFGLVLGIASALLLVSGGLGAGLAFLWSKLSPLPYEKSREADEPEVDEIALAARHRAYRQGLLVLIGLALLTVLEFLVASLASGSIMFLFVLALAKAGLILQYFMHLDKLWTEEAH